jgi:hypothetical protein
LRLLSGRTPQVIWIRPTTFWPDDARERDVPFFFTPAV